MTNQKTPALLKPWTDYAAGTVDGVYPCPVEPNNITELCIADSHTPAEFVQFELACKFNTGYMGKDVKQVSAVFAGQEDTRTTGDTNRHRTSDAEFTYTGVKALSYDVVDRISAPSVPDLVLEMLRRGCRGTLKISYVNFPNGFKCHPEVVETFLIIL